MGLGKCTPYKRIIVLAIFSLKAKLILDSMVVELVILTILVVGIVLVGIGVLHYTRRAVGYASGRIGAFGRYTGRVAETIYQRSRSDIRRPSVVIVERPVITYGPTGEPIVQYSPSREIRPRPLELAYEGVVAPALAQHGQDIKVEPEVNLMFSWLGHYTRVATDVITGWIDRRRRREEEG